MKITVIKDGNVVPPQYVIKDEDGNYLMSHNDSLMRLEFTEDIMQAKYFDFKHEANQISTRLFNVTGQKHTVTTIQDVPIL